tara:strand:- start:1668 stop:2108 length:441 start_codon:yes stop_codon:yes gene_type:complete
MKPLTLAASAFAVLAFSPAVQAASASYSASGHYDVAAPQVTLAKHDKHDDKKHQKQHKKAVKEYKKAIKKHEKQHSDNGRHLAKGHDKHHHAKGDKLTRYVVIEQPHRHGLTRYNRYVQDDGYVYAVDPQTDDVLALIGLASRLLN